MWNQLPDTLETKWSFQTFKRPLSDWFGPKYKNKVSSHVNNTKVLLRTRLNIGFDLNYISFLMQILCIQNYSFLHCIFLIFFYPRINKPNKHNNITEISNFQNGVNDLFSSTGSYFKSKVIEGSHKGGNMFFDFSALLLKLCIFEVVNQNVHF